MRNTIERGLVVLTACQIRAARAMLRWPIEELARRSGVSQATLRRIESVYGVPNVRLDTLSKLQRSFEAAGVRFLADDGQVDGGPGLRFGCYPGRPAPSTRGQAAENSTH